MPSIYNLDTADLVHLQGWYKRKPMQYAKVAKNVVNTMAFMAKTEAIMEIESHTTTRNKGFVKHSLRITKARYSRDLNNIASSMGSIDISGAGRATGFKELEVGGQYQGRSVPTIASRMGNKKRRVLGKVRYKKSNKFIKYTQIAGKGFRTKRQKVAAMLRIIRASTPVGTAFFFPGGAVGPKMRPMGRGVWRKMAGNRLKLANPSRGKRGRTKKIAWMDEANRQMVSSYRMKQIWLREIDRALRRK